MREILYGTRVGSYSKHSDACIEAYTAIVNLVAACLKADLCIPNLLSNPDLGVVICCVFAADELRYTNSIHVCSGHFFGRYLYLSMVMNVDIKDCTNALGYNGGYDGFNKKILRSIIVCLSMYMYNYHSSSCHNYIVSLRYFKCIFGC